MSSRLDRLFLLLDSGSSPLTRKAAALQLGEVQKLHPHELHNLLAKVRHYLHSNTWETRIAAGQAVEAIINNVPQWNPPGVAVKQENNNVEEIHNSSLAGRMKFSQFDINKVIQNGSDLLASEGTEFEDDENTEMDVRERLAKQRQMLNQRLGLADLGFDTSYLSNEDFDVNNSPANLVVQELKRDVSEVYNSEISQISSNSRKAAKARQRYGRSLSRQMTRDKSGSSLNSPDCGEPSAKKKRCTPPFVEKSHSEDSVDSATNYESLLEEPKEWPLESFSDELVQDLFNAAWEIRHGAATALREIVRLHGKGAGRRANVSVDQMENLNQLWLEDLALRLTCVLALDKFGDFVSDQVVAPVRETCAQALGIVMNIMSHEGVEGVLRILLQLLARPEWEARHGGLLGLKYVLAARKDMKSILIPLVFDPVCKGLKDSVDDVSAVAASALVPVTSVIVSLLPEKVSSIVSLLWDALLDLDDLTASTSSILQLLSSLLSYVDSSSPDSLSSEYDKLIPRLWPFLSHASSVVRKSVLQALNILTSVNTYQLNDFWVQEVLPTTLRLIYQRCLLEHQSDIHELLYTVWRNIIMQSSLVSVITATVPFLSSWISMLMQPSKVPIDPSTNVAWLDVQHKAKDKILLRGRNSSSSFTNQVTQEKCYIGGCDAFADNTKEREKCVAQAKMTAAKFVGFLTSYITKPIPGVVYASDAELPIDSFVKLILFHLKYKSALQRLAVSFVLSEWANHDGDKLCPVSVKECCLECLNENIYYDEIAVAFTRMQQECRDFVAQLRHNSIPLEDSFSQGSVFTCEQLTHLTTVVFPSAVASVKLKPKILETLEERRKSLIRNVEQTSHDQSSLTIMVQAGIAGALVSLKYLPEKLNPLIRPLMDSIKKEENELLKRSSALHLVHLMELCLTRTSCPNPKIIKNLCNFLCNNIAIKPNENSMDVGENVPTPEPEEEIITLTNMQKSAEILGLRRSNSVLSRKISTAQIEDVLLSDDEKASNVQKQGAAHAFTLAAEHFKDELPQKLPKLWEAMFQPMEKYVNPNNSDGKMFAPETDLHELLCSLELLKTVGPSLHEKLHLELENILLKVCCCLEHNLAIVRHKAANLLGMLSKVITVKAMNIILNKVLSKLGATDNNVQRQGAVEAIACIIDELGLNVVPYIVFLIVPLLGRMSDQNEPVRLLATFCFASLIKLMPLEGGIANPPLLHPELMERKEKEKLFLEQLMNPKQIDSFVIPVPVKAELRSYQQEGINWLAFLNKYKLHGILCDDMGLGKTLQSICILAGDHYAREQLYNKTKQPDCKPLSSLVVCPPTLTGHWMYEVEKFVQPSYLNPIHYTGPPSERIRLRSRTKKHNLVIASYDIVRNDISFFGSIHWNYCILDEGHIIKNGKTKLARAIKQLSANHRLILSGTPIQNNVLELWSLFDFLMPGFLGTEKQFTTRYSKPILQSRDAKSSSKEQETGVLAMESLHRQVLPFLLRRMKEDVLKDLPPKIIQDYYCELSALQVQLYEDFAKSRAKQSVKDTLEDSEVASSHGTSHIFQALQYLRKVCNHPRLVLTPNHPEYENILKQMKENDSSLCDINHAAKLCALKQLLEDCGIGTVTTNSAQNEPEPVVNQHRALIFCQLKGMLDILENDLLKSLMPTVSYLRLDGSIPPGMRHSVVHRFNNDPSIDVLLLTTQVGGLGLNLTGADTVIFVEHDWNPMKDLQAMDRAHRIGQKKVVNVYRLITRGTLEEKIMGLQKFKLSIANSVINQENTDLQNMGTDQLLDLFSLDNKGEKISSLSSSGEASNSGTKGIKSVLESLPELWDTDQYESEYDLTNFLKSLHT